MFASQEYNNTAAIFWQDFWSNTLAPDVSAMVSALLARLGLVWCSQKQGKQCVEMQTHTDAATGKMYCGAC